MDPSFWRGRRVLVTGHTGFKGSWLSLWLQEAGARLCGFSLAPPTDPSLYDLADVQRGMRSVHGDVRDLDAVRAVMAEHDPEIVLHLAAQSLVRESYADPVSTFATNVMGTIHVLEAARSAPACRVVIVVTSDKCYDNREWLWGYRENDPLGGRDPYSASKGCAELASAAYRASFFASGERRAAVATVRAGNVIGGGDWAKDRLVPDLVRSFSAGERVLIRNPDAIRPWQHVLEPVSGYVLLAEWLWQRGPDAAGAWNFGPAMSDGRSVRWLVDALATAWGQDARWDVDARPQPAEAGLLRLDSTKAATELGWMPRWNLTTTLRSIVEWHKAHAAGVAPRAITLEQIRTFAATNAEHAS